MNWFIFGAGFSGLETGRALLQAGVKAAGTTRGAAKSARLAAAGLEPFAFDGALHDALAARLQSVTHLLMSIGPDNGGDPLLPALDARLAAATPSLQWIGYLSTVGVYGDHDGAWVDEGTVCRPVSPRSVERLKAEAAWAGFAASKQVPLAVMRLSGIYGPGRNAFVNLAEGTAKRLVKPGQVFNRIHVADIAGAALHLGGGHSGGLFNVSDDEPAPPQDVVACAAGLMGIAPPPEQPYDEAVLSPMARSFYSEVKRVSNRKLRQSGYALRYPHYRLALEAMWREGRWRG